MFSYGNFRKIFGHFRVISFGYFRIFFPDIFLAFPFVFCGHFDHFVSVFCVFSLYLFAFSSKYQCFHTSLLPFIEILIQKRYITVVNLFSYYCIFTLKLPFIISGFV